MKKDAPAMSERAPAWAEPRERATRAAHLWSARWLKAAFHDF